MVDGTLSACRVTFGAEPKDYEVWEFVLRHYYELKFSSALKTERKKVSMAQKEVEQQRRFEMKQQKRKEKHNGH